MLWKHPEHAHCRGATSRDLGRESANYFRIQKMNLIGLSWGSILAALYTDAAPRGGVARIVLPDSHVPALDKPYSQQRDKERLNP